MGLIGLCGYCGAPIEEGAQSCAYCGMPVERPEPPRRSAAYAPPPPVYRQAETPPAAHPAYGRPKNKWVAFLLCLFLGVFGAHKFYEERFGLGILYFLTGGLFGVGWFVDLIILLCKPDPYYL